MKRALEIVNEKILAAVPKKKPDIICSPDRIPRLVAVSKFKPIEMIIEAYECGQRHFGENYIQELLDKSNSPEIIEKCPEIKFHFIGHLQSNKVNKLPKVRNLFMLETIDSTKLATLVDKAYEKHTSINVDQGETFKSLKVMIQVNTSGEEAKSGIEPSEAPELAEHIKSNCKNLKLTGLMTIGKLDGWEGVVNMDFVRLHQVRNEIAEKLSIEPSELELSMGMSNDFDEAITYGSTNIRVGSLIFGAR